MKSGPCTQSEERAAWNEELAQAEQMELREAFLLRAKLASLLRITEDTWGLVLQEAHS